MLIDDTVAADPTNSSGGPRNIGSGIGSAVFVASVLVLVFLRMRRE